MIGIINTGAGNQLSVKHALLRLKCESVISNDVKLLSNCDKIIFPGVGQASYTMKQLKNHKLDEFILSFSKPFLGICLGMQIMCNYSEEGNTKGLGIFDADTLLFPSDEAVPHMGWNNISDMKGQLFEGLDEQDDFYFVHSYFVTPNSYSLAACDYILPFCAAMQKDNFYATQFHPEKSAKPGSIILQNFLRL